jgi:IS605 OrfB family transposase
LDQPITIKLKLLNPTQHKKEVYQTMADRNTAFANQYLNAENRPKTSKDASVELPSAVVNQSIRDLKAKKKAKHIKRLWPGFNNQNFRVEKEASESGGAAWKVSFPTIEKRIGVPIVVQPFQEKHLNALLSGQSKQGTAYLIRKDHGWYIHLSLTLAVAESSGEKILGIDLGLIDLLVASASGRTLFFLGGGVSYIRRHYTNIRHSMQQNNAHRAIQKLDDKVHHWITDQNHKISRQVIAFAAANGVACIRMEDLTGIRWTKRQNRKQRQDHGRSLHSWAFYQLQGFIQYKATLAGIRVEYVNRYNTSLTCSRCGELLTSRPSSRIFICPRCKQTKHIDANAADNIAQAISGLAS